MKQLHFKQEQIKEILAKLQIKNGYNNILQISLEAIMLEDRCLHNEQNSDVSNGYQ